MFEKLLPVLKWLGLNSDKIYELVKSLLEHLRSTHTAEEKEILDDMAGEVGSSKEV